MRRHVKFCQSIVLLSQFRPISLYSRVHQLALGNRCTTGADAVEKYLYVRECSGFAFIFAFIIYGLLEYVNGRNLIVLQTLERFIVLDYQAIIYFIHLFQLKLSGCFVFFYFVHDTFHKTIFVLTMLLACDYHPAQRNG